MASYKIDGAKFASVEELKKSLWELYSSKMSEAEFDEYVNKNMETVE